MENDRNAMLNTTQFNCRFICNHALQLNLSGLGMAQPYGLKSLATALMNPTQCASAASNTRPLVDRLGLKLIQPVANATVRMIFKCRD